MLTRYWGHNLWRVKDAARLSFGYALAIFLADLDDLPNSVFQICLHRKVNVAAVVHGDALNVFELAAKGRNGSQLFVRFIDVQLSVATVADVERTTREKNRLRRETIPLLDQAMQLPVRVEQIEHV